MECLARTYISLGKQYAIFASILGLVLLTSLMGRQGLASEGIDIDFSNLDYFDGSNSTGVWNSIERRVEAALAPGGVAGKEIQFGNGTDGNFYGGQEQSGITISENTITFNTDVKNEFHFRNFSIHSALNVQVTGSQALTIRVLGETTILGWISLDGGSGASNSTGGAGGNGVGAGGSGGAGGVPSLANGVSGSPSGTPTRAGAGGVNSAVGGTNRGGGGACLGQGPDARNSTSGFDGSINLGNAGNCAAEGTRSAIGADLENKFTGGAGGGGGGAYASGADQVRGGGGGAGGGAIHLTSLGPILLNGDITARGGDGGDNLDIVGFVNCGGGGGGGSGGTIWLQTSSTISGVGAVLVDGGLGGTPTEAFCSYQGGNGSRGIVTLDSQTAATAPVVVGPLGQTDSAQQTQYTSGQTYVVYSRPIDVSRNQLIFTGATETLGCGSSSSNLTVSYQGSNDGVKFSSAVSASSLSELSGYDFIRFIVQIVSDGSNTPCLTGLTLNYVPQDLSELTLSGGLFCGSLEKGQNGQGDFLFLIIVLTFFRALLLRKRLQPTRYPS